MERLTRFRSPFEKLERVYKEVLTKYSIEPKISARNFWDYNLFEINSLFQYIWNKSIEPKGKIFDENCKINLYLAFEEMKEFSAIEFIKNLIKSGKLSFYKPERYSLEVPDFCRKDCFKEIEEIFRRAKLIDEEFYEKVRGFNEIERFFLSYKMKFPLNIHGFLNILKKETDISEKINRLIWLDKFIQKKNIDIQDSNLKEKLENIYAEACKYRQKNGVLSPIELVVVTEGITEEILLPAFSEFAGINFDKNGIKIISPGGKNQMLKLYKKLSGETNLPILMIFDSDGFEEANSIKNNLRNIDEIYIIPGGEFEDILPDKLICKAVNIHYRLTGEMNLSDIAGAEKKSRTLSDIWKEKGFGEFKKSEFAKIIAKNISKKSDLSNELKTIFVKISSKLNN